jgi:hypothetical protein
MSGFQDMTAKLAFVLVALSSGDAANPPCDPTTDHPSDCYGLTEIGKDTPYTHVLCI